VGALTGPGRPDPLSAAFGTHATLNAARVGPGAVTKLITRGEPTVLLQMVVAGVVFVVTAVAAALCGFGVVSDDNPLAAKLCAGFFAVAAAAAFGWAWMNRSRTVVGHEPLRSGRARRGTTGASNQQPGERTELAGRV
jgi:hypothetical protein